MEEALFETPLYRHLTGLSGSECIPDRVSILRFRHLLEEHQLGLQLATVNNTQAAKGLQLKSGTAIDAHWPCARSRVPTGPPRCRRRRWHTPRTSSCWRRRSPSWWTPRRAPASSSSRPLPKRAGMQPTEQWNSRELRQHVQERLRGRP
jgi:IS5 family transposase